MLRFCLAREEHNSTRPNTDTTKMKSKPLKASISLHWVQREPRVRKDRYLLSRPLWYLPSSNRRGTCLATHTKQELDTVQGPRSHWRWHHHGLTVPRLRAWLLLQNCLCHCQIHMASLQEIPSIWGSWGDISSYLSSSLMPSFLCLTKVHSSQILISEIGSWWFLIPKAYPLLALEKTSWEFQHFP